jgi:toxin CptA
MHNAPSVSFPVGRCAFLRNVYLIFCLLTSALLLSWTLVQPWHIGMPVAVVLLAVSGVLGWRQCQRQALLQWSGYDWVLTQWPQGVGSNMEIVGADEVVQIEGLLPVEGVPVICLDLQSILLLYFQPLSGQTTTMHWLWCQRGVDDERWQDFRRAVYAAQTNSRRDVV